MLSLIVFFLVADTPAAHVVIQHIGSYGYLGSVITGIFFVSTFTVVPASAVLFHLAEEYNPFLIAITAGFGSMLGDLILFRFVQDKLFAELAPLVKRIQDRPVLVLFKSSYFAWLTPVLGAIIIASPLPDEVGIGMMGLSKISRWKFILLTFTLNTLGILAIVLLAQTS